MIKLAAFLFLSAAALSAGSASAAVRSDNGMAPTSVHPTFAMAMKAALDIGATRSQTTSDTGSAVRIAMPAGKSVHR